MRKWVLCAIYVIVYILFVAWVGNFWWLLLIPLIVDMVLTKFIPWTAWKKIKNKTLYTICSWLDAIVFALVAVYFINIYLFQNYQIPSSSLEKTLLVGDYLFVSKVAYGPRVPNTPLSLPLVQNTLPIVNTRSYIEKPQWDYHRLKGFGNVQRGDIVVFNFPAGDTVPLNVSNPDYYTLCYYNSLGAMPPTDSIISYSEYRQRMKTGAEAIAYNANTFGEVIWRPVDKRENYVKRCIGLPGETLEIRNDVVYINGQALQDPPQMQHSYYVETDGTVFTADYLKKLDIRLDESYEITNPELLRYMAIGVDTLGRTTGRVFRLSLTKASLQKIQALPFVKTVKQETDTPDAYATIYPLAYSQRWTVHNYGPLYIPKKGETITLTEDNLLRYERIITAYEHNTLDFRNGHTYINGEEASTYTFKMDYYWMMGDNRDNSADSRMWGFVPEDHIVGRPVFIFFSTDDQHGWGDGHIRFNRFFKSARK
ncbi:MAG: signal peptidase I [Bacteroidales bacterium]|nr:signal peptidase I [Bacteroidales bacterium]